jgi:hypothetical protein
MEYQHLKEDLHDLAMVAEWRDEGTLNLAELKKMCHLRNLDGLIFALF